jgi:Ser/Thr protein kinase RdoA (MazF antagonist)
MLADRLSKLIPIAELFTPAGRVSAIAPLGNGNINDTFLVTVEDGVFNVSDTTAAALQSSESRHFVLQRLNTRVFRQPERVMANIQRLGQHVSDRLQQEPRDRPWQIPQVLVARQGNPFYCTDNGDYWRALSYLDNSQTYDTLRSPKQAREVGYALGMFHSLVSDLPAHELADTLEGFHITPLYFEQYQQVIAQNAVPASPEVQFCQQFIHDRLEVMTILETAKQQGQLPLRVMHGDPKINNVLFDKGSDRAIGMIDLDTVKPGLIHYDIGDCLRSGCNLLGEETEDWQAVEFDIDLCREILQGYSSVAKSFLTEGDRDYFYEAIRLLPLELGLRFFSDYLAGNVYFKTHDPDHNLRRALVQFQLTRSIEQKEPILQAILRDLR